MDELPASLAALVKEARTAHEPRPEDARRVGAALGAAIPGFQLSLGVAQLHAASASGSAASGGTFAGLAGAAKWVGVLAAVAAAGAATTMRAPATERATHRTSAVVARAHAHPGRAPVATVPSNSGDVDTNVAAVASTSTDTDPSASAPMRASPAREPRRRSTPARAAEPGAGAATPAAVSTPSVELSLIRRAAEALRDHDPAVARQFLEQHEARFPEGTLKQERVAMTLVALCEEGKLAEVRSMRDRFLADNPDSPAAARVKSACREPDR